MEKELLVNLKKVQKNIKKSAEKAGRESEKIKLLAVTKNQNLKDIKKLRRTGFNSFGENRVQELNKKNKKLNDSNLNVNWNFIGHLQTNKVKYLMRMENCKMIQSLDSLRLAKEINKRAKKNKREMKVLVQINIAGDENKFGINPDDAGSFLHKINSFDNLNIKGLMTVLPYLDNSKKIRNYFKEMKDLFDKLSAEVVNLDELSMGMTNDYKIAVEEGATIVRVGRAIFGEREY